MSGDAALLGAGTDPGGQLSRRLAVELDAFVSEFHATQALGDIDPL